MSSLKQIKLAQKSAHQQQQLVHELEALAKDIERCEKTIVDLKMELIATTQKYPASRTTREDIAYLTDLLRCANKKLVWEKHLTSLQKRTPALLERLTRLVNDEANPPAESTRADILRVLQMVQEAMARLESAKVS